MSHGPRGDIVSVYTTFPWPALCAEIAKLKIELRSPSVLGTGSKAFATGFATAHLKGRNRWKNSVTPSGIEAGRNVTESRRVTVAPTEDGALEWPAAVSGCNECNEALDAARAAITASRRLVLVAENALVNGDLLRARAALRELHAATTSGGVLTPRARPTSSRPARESS